MASERLYGFYKWKSLSLCNQLEPHSVWLFVNCFANLTFQWQSKWSIYWNKEKIFWLKIDSIFIYCYCSISMRRCEAIPFALIVINLIKFHTEIFSIASTRAASNDSEISQLSRDCCCSSFTLVEFVALFSLWAQCDALAYVQLGVHMRFML